MTLDTHTDSDFFIFLFYEQSYAYLGELLPFVPTAEFCANPIDNSTTFGILEPGIFYGEFFIYYIFYNTLCKLFW